MQRIRYATVALLSAAVVIFAVQNLVPPVEVQFLAWRFTTNVTLVTLVPFLAGLVVGGLGVLWARRRRPPDREPRPEAPARPPYLSEEDRETTGP